MPVILKWTNIQILLVLEQVVLQSASSEATYSFRILLNQLHPCFARSSLLLSSLIVVVVVVFLCPIRALSIMRAKSMSLPTTFLWLLSVPDNDLGSVYLCMYHLGLSYTSASICLLSVCALSYVLGDRHSDSLTLISILPPSQLIFVSLVSGPILGSCIPSIFLMKFFSKFIIHFLFTGFHNTHFFLSDSSWMLEGCCGFGILDLALGNITVESKRAFLPTLIWFKMSICFAHVKQELVCLK